MPSKKVNFEDIGADLGKLVAEKQLAYGDSFGRSGECLRQMFPDGIKPTQYDDVLTIARILDKLFRIANSPNAFGENPYGDIGGYSILGYGRYQKNREEVNDHRKANSKRKTKRSNRIRQRPKGSARKILSKGQRGEDSRRSQGDVSSSSNSIGFLRKR